MRVACLPDAIALQALDLKPNYREGMDQTWALRLPTRGSTRSRVRFYVRALSDEPHGRECLAVPAHRSQRRK